MRQVSGLSRKFSSFKHLSIGVLCGGKSSERKISIKSGRAIYRSLRASGLNVSLIDPGKPGELNKKIKKIDVAFIALHGEGGEDGKIQSYLERRGVPYTGSSIEACRRSLDKFETKKVLRAKAIPTADFVAIDRRHWKRQIQTLTPPLFAKPLFEGSSIGTFSIQSIAGENRQIEKSLKKYGKLLIEKKIIGREFTVGVLADKALPVVEMRPKNEFYDFKAKYTAGMTDYLVPAKISRALSRLMQKYALATHRALGLRDLSRIDFMVDRNNQPFVLEANSIPGFTEFSLLPKAAASAGIPFDVLCCRLIEMVIHRSPKLIKKLEGYGKEKKA